MKELIITSPSFENDGWIPNKHTGYGEDISPELRIEGIDERGKTMVIILNDASHPLFANYNHWIAWNIPIIDKIPENLPKGSCLDTPIHINQGRAYGKNCYRGPKPPFNLNHKYMFIVYVIDIKLDLSEQSKREDVLKAIEGHIIQRGELVGKYQRRRF